MRANEKERRLQCRGGRPAESAAMLDALAGDGPGLVAAAYLLATDILQDSGLPEAPQLTRDGELRSGYWATACCQASGGGRPKLR